MLHQPQEQGTGATGAPRAALRTQVPRGGSEGFWGGGNCFFFVVCYYSQLCFLAYKVMWDCFRQSPSRWVRRLSGQEQNVRAKGGAADGQYVLPKSGRVSRLQCQEAQIPANDLLMPILWVLGRKLRVRHPNKTISALYIQPYVCQTQCMLRYSLVLCSANKLEYIKGARS